MKALHIAIKDLLVTLRDWQGLMIFLVMPMVLIAILGASMSSNFTGTPKLGEFTVALVDNDGGELSGTLRVVLQAPELKSFIHLTEMSETEAKESIAAGSLQVALVVPQGFTSSVYAGGEANLVVLKEAGARIRPMVVESIANSFVEYVSAGRIAAQVAMSKGMPPQVAGLIVERIQELSPEFREEVAHPHRSLLSAFQYYAAAMAVMFMMMSGNVGLESIAVEKRNLTWDRLMSSPTSPASLIGGKFLAVLLVNSLQFIVLMLGTSLLYKVSWGDNVFMVIVAGVCYGVAVSGLSLLVAATIPSSNVGLAVWGIGVQICAALGGSMVPLMILPKAIQSFARITPNFWGLRMFTALMGGEALQFSYVLPLLLIGLVGLSIGGGKLILAQRRA